MMERMNNYAKKHEETCRRNDMISPRLYEEYGVNLGLRDEKGNGVLTGLTRISKIVSSKIENGQKVPCDGQLWYRGYRVEDLIAMLDDKELGFEKAAYMLLMGEMPSQSEYEEFFRLIGESRTLPPNFTRGVIMRKPGADIMNTMTRSILNLAAYDEQAMEPAPVHTAYQPVSGAGSIWLQCL